MNWYSQQDPRWGKEKLGSSPCTIARWGCTTTAIAMLMTRFGSTITPNEAARRFKYTPDGLLSWGATNFHPLRFVSRVRQYDEKTIREWIKDKNHVAIIEVKNKYIPFHWVAADRFSIIGLNVIDPLAGTAIRLSSKYTPIGYALFEKIPG